MRKDIQVLFREYNRDYFNGELPDDLPVIWNYRLRTTAGRAHYYRVGNTRLIDAEKIELNPHLLDTEEKIFNTLIHEMVHAWFAHLNGYCCKHGPPFQRKMNSIVGYKKSHRCHSYDTTGLEEERKIEGHCPIHGIVSRRKRMPRVPRICRACKSDITYVDKRMKTLKKSFNPLSAIKNEN